MEEDLQEPINHVRKSSVSLDIEREDSMDEKKKDKENVSNEDEEEDKSTKKVHEEWNEKHVSDRNAHQVMKEIEVEIIYFVHKYMNLKKK